MVELKEDRSLAICLNAGGFQIIDLEEAVSQ